VKDYFPMTEEEDVEWHKNKALIDKAYKELEVVRTNCYAYIESLEKRNKELTDAAYKRLCDTTIK